MAKKNSYREISAAPKNGPYIRFMNHRNSDLALVPIATRCVGTHETKNYYDAIIVHDKYMVTEWQLFGGKGYMPESVDHYFMASECFKKCPTQNEDYFAFDPLIFYKDSGVEFIDENGYDREIRIFFFDCDSDEKSLIAYSLVDHFDYGEGRDRWFMASDLNKMSIAVNERTGCKNIGCLISTGTYYNDEYLGQIFDNIKWYYNVFLFPGNSKDIVS